METKEIIKKILERVNQKIKDRNKEYKNTVQVLPPKDILSYKQKISVCLSELQIYLLIRDKLLTVDTDNLEHIQLMLFKDLLPECATRYQVSIIQVINSDIDKIKNGKDLDVIKVKI